MKVVRIILAGLMALPAVLSAISLAIGLLNVVEGNPVYGSQRAAGSLILCGLFAVMAFALWPRRTQTGHDVNNQVEPISSDQSKADIVVSIAATRLGLSKTDFDASLTTELSCPPIEVMNLWDDLAEEFDLDLSSDDFPEINSISALKTKLSG